MVQSVLLINFQKLHVIWRNKYMYCIFDVRVREAFNQQDVHNVDI